MCAYLTLTYLMLSRTSDIFLCHSFEQLVSLSVKFSNVTCYCDLNYICGGNRIMIHKLLIIQYSIDTLLVSLRPV